MTPTPGPWVIKRESGLRQRIQSASGGTLAYMTARPLAHGANFSWEQIAANAALIAAAPDLLAALEAILSDDDLIYTGGAYASLEKAGLDSTDKLATKARAAIKKARGE